jgi:branched-chain amino acid transport system substrate-binding protein
MHSTTRRQFLSTLAGSLLLGAVPARARELPVVKLAFIDPLTGPFAAVGQNQLQSWQFVADRVNRGNTAGVKFEIVPFDNKGAVQDTLTAFQAAVDQGIRYVLQGDGSGAALALSKAVSRHNARHPGKEVVYLNYAAVDPALTGSDCSFWHFALQPSVPMTLQAMTDDIRNRPDIQRVYLIEQDYSFGHQVAKYAREMLARKRPDIQIVGEDFVALGQVKDFSPYIAKVQAAKADCVITANWGPDLTLLIKAAQQGGLKADLYTFYASSLGAPSEIGPHDAGRVKLVYYSEPNLPGILQSLQKGFRDKYKQDFSVPVTYTGLLLLTAAMTKAHSIEPIKVASAMEGLTFHTFNGEVTMRAADHQLLQPIYVSTWQPVSAASPYNVENTGYTFALDHTYPPSQTTLPAQCTMQRPLTTEIYPVKPPKIHASAVGGAQ